MWIVLSMDMRLILLTTLLISLQVNFCYSLLLECPIYQLRFQKTVGFRPHPDLLTDKNILYDAQPSNPFEIINPICWDLCNNDENCIAYTLLLDSNRCFGFSIFDLSHRYQHLGLDGDLVPDSNAIYFERVCVKVPQSCNGKLWVISKIPGSSFVFRSRKTLSTLVTKRDCIERCLFETDFPCLSASFTPSYKNNQARFGESVARTERLGRCVLSDKDKMLQPDAFRAASFDEEYIENQCYDRPIENESCSYELYSNSTFIYAEVGYNGLTQKECQASCSSETKFFCQGVSYLTNPNLANTECLLHSEDIISMGPRSVKFKLMSVYMRRVKCLDVTVMCSNNEMAVKYSPGDSFRGKIYVSSHSQDCATLGNGTKSTLLRLAIGSEIQEKRCGIVRAYEVSKQYQRTFISALVVIQNNVNVQTQGDRLIKVGCIVSNSTQTNNQLPNAIALESSLAFAQNHIPNEVSTHFNGSNVYIPTITMRVLDLSQQHETNDVQIGQNLVLQIIAKPPDTPYDFEATSLIAKANNGTNFIVLIDERGCPTDVTLFPALTKVTTADSKILYSPFHAFKFAGTSLVSFDVKINFCFGMCLSVICQDVVSRRNRRQSNTDRLYGDAIHIKNPLYVATIMEQLQEPNSTDINDNPLMPPYSMEVPLKYDINVHGPNIVDTKGLIYGEKGIVLVAGVDESSAENICIHHSLFIAVLIFWFIFQVALMFSCCYLIQKYKRLGTIDDERKKIQESIDYYDARRVHWADQGVYSL